MKGTSSDVLVIGAGPAGAFAARLLARAGVGVLLVDRARFPRSKVCGGCLAGPGFEVLARDGLSSIPALRGARRVGRLHLCASGRTLDIPLPEYRVVDRALFDRDLVEAGVAEGVEFHDRTRACVEPGGWVRLSPAGIKEAAPVRISPRAVLVAGGLKGDALRSHPGFSWHTRPGSLVGLGAVASGLPDACPRDAVTMMHGAQGYAGVAPLHDGRALIAAAVSPAWLARNRSGPPLLALLDDLGVASIGKALLGPTRGVPMLTRRRSAVEAEARVFVIGDAAGYIEPFTGEGMTWALESAGRVVPCVLDAVRGRYEPGAWTATFRRGRWRRTILCRSTASLLKSPCATRAVVALCGGRAGLTAGLGGIVRRLQCPGSSMIGSA